MCDSNSDCNDEDPCTKDVCSNGICSNLPTVEGEVEVCNGIDDDCDLIVDEQDAQGCSVWYKDQDGHKRGTDDSKCLWSPT